ncbi:MAG TPA: CRISPR-associated endonuclease Cas2 [Planctomycetota bacterium]|nr:CRISPR-associated endonuclease Cas2 [Planctomycetota bacterium]
MLVLVSYDVSTVTPEGRRRLRRVAQTCLDYGQRVQNSVFECVVDPARWVLLRNRLLAEANLDEDSLRFYFLGDNWRRRLEHLGAKVTYDPDDTMIV